MEKLSRAECLRRLRDEDEKILAAIVEEKRKEYVSWIYGAFTEKQLHTFTDRMEEKVQEYCSPQQLEDEAYLENLRTDMLFCYFNYGCDFDEYFIYHFPEKSHLQRSQFITNNRREAWYNKFNRPDLQVLYDDKGRTYETYKPYFKRECFTVRGPEDEDGFLDFCSRQPVFFAKDAMGFWGRGVNRVVCSECGDLREYFKNELLARAPVHLEEPIRQGAEMAALHSSSINTIRIITITDRQGRMHIIDCCLRMGRGGSVIDNYSSGGIYCMVEPERGYVCTDGLDKICIPFECHPDSGVRFRGFRIPGWDALLELLRELVTVVPEVRLCGWDLAWSEDGWVVVEANHCAELGAQADFGCGWMRLFEAIL